MPSPIEAIPPPIDIISLYVMPDMMSTIPPLISSKPANMVNRHPLSAILFKMKPVITIATIHDVG